MTNDTNLEDYFTAPVVVKLFLLTISSNLIQWSIKNTVEKSALPDWYASPCDSLRFLIFSRFSLFTFMALAFSWWSTHLSCLLPFTFSEISFSDILKASLLTHPYIAKDFNVFWTFDCSLISVQLFNNFQCVPIT